MKVSVIVPVYNKGKVLRRCLTSILRQTEYNIEVLMIDDGSTDNSSEICRDFQKLDVRFRYFKQNNGGVSQARNEGLLRSSGQFVAFVDADDWLTRDAIQRMVEFCEKQNLDWCSCGVLSSLDTDSTARCSEVFISEDVSVPNCNIDTSVVWGKLFRGKYLKDRQILFEEDMVVAEDSLFMTKAYYLANRVGHLGTLVGYHYEPNPEGLMFSKREAYFDATLNGLCLLSHWVQNERRLVEGWKVWEGNVAAFVCSSGYLEFREKCLKIRRHARICSIPHVIPMKYRIKPRFIIYFLSRLAVHPFLLYCLIRTIVILRNRIMRISCA